MTRFGLTVNDVNAGQVIRLSLCVANIKAAAAALRDTGARPTDEALRAALRRIAESAQDGNTSYTTGEGHAQCIKIARAALLTQENSDNAS